MGWGKEKPETTVTLFAKVIISCPLTAGNGCFETEHEFYASANAQLPLLADEEKEIRDQLRHTAEEAAKAFMEKHV